MSAMTIAGVLAAFVVVLAALFLLIRTRMRTKALAEYFDELMAKPSPAMDFNTPQGAILCLEEAYRKKDIEAAVRCKDFKTEARLMLKRIDKESGVEAKDDAELLDLTADTLELSFRKHISEAWPDLNGVESCFEKTREYEPGVVVVREVGRSQEGRIWVQELLVGKVQDGWRVLNPL